MIRSAIAVAAGAAILLTAAFLKLAGGGQAAGGPEQGPGQPAASEARGGKVYGEWSIRVKPDKGAEYAQLIKEQGLPLFREAGGRMVGWWNTLIGDLYEQVTIWEYDGMPAFEKAIGFLGGNERFHKFVGLRDPLLSGEDCRFLRLQPWAEKPALPEQGNFVVLEIHRVPPAQMETYLRFMQHALPVLKRAGFQPAGPWDTAVGKGNEVTYLFRYQSLEERDRLIGAFRASAEGQSYLQRLTVLVESITTRLLVPAPFAK